VAEKKTLEIAHSFLDDGETTPAVKLRNTESAVHNAASVRRTDSGRTFSSPTALVCCLQFMSIVADTGY